MARRSLRRRKPRVAWLPTFGGAMYPEWDAGPYPGINFGLDFDTSTPADAVLYDAFALTFDYSESATAAQGSSAQTLRDLVSGNEWRLRRIVGKAFMGTWQGTVGSGYSWLLDCALGFIVVKCDDDGVPETDFGKVNPLSQDSMEDPWIWRRRWILNPFGQLETGSNTQNLPPAWGFPRATTDYGSVLDGPHIDAKSQRVIHRQERLFAVVAGRRWSQWNNTDPPAPGYADGGIRGVLDYRLLGSLRSSAIGNRGNASR